MEEGRGRMEMDYDADNASSSSSSGWSTGDSLFESFNLTAKVL